MMYSEAIPRAEEYARRRNLSIEKQLGGGIQGVVYSTHEGTAVKALIRPEFYTRERDVYLRLKHRGIEKIAGFNVNDPEIMVPWEDDKREQFEERWPAVKRVMSAFEGLGIYLSDIKPGNIEFGD
jgi:hypothetical protein